MTVLAARRVLAVQPHYDDNDIGCGGTLALLGQAGCEIISVTVTDDLAGVLDTEVDDATARRRLVAEQRAAGAITGITKFVGLEWPDAGGLDHVAFRNQIIDLIREHRPDLVLTVDPRLPNEAHRDHVVTGEAVSEAVLLSGLGRVRRATGAEAFEVERIGYYFTKDANETIDTSEAQRYRHAVLDCYVSQFDADGLAELHAALDRHERHHAPRGATHGEQLKVLSPAALHVAL